MLGTSNQVFYQDTTTQVAIITTIGLVIVALIGIFTAKVTSGARKEIQVKSFEASKSADVAKDFALALEAKKVLIDSLEDRVRFLEDQTYRQAKRIEELERREDEYTEQRRAAASLERSYAREVDDLRALVEEQKRKRGT